MRMTDYTSLDEFVRRYYDMIAKICAVSIDNNIEDTTDRAFALWCDVRSWANRKPTNLCFDCVYIIGNAMGNKNSVPFLAYISEQLFQQKIKPMYSKRSARWFIAERGREAIVSALADSPSDIKTHHHELYEDAVRLWLTEEDE